MTRVPDPKMNEAAVAYIIPKAAEHLIETDIITHFKDTIASNECRTFLEQHAFRSLLT